MSATQRFLVEACRTAGQGRYFRWLTVGSALGFSTAESQKLMESLNARKLVLLLSDGDARLLDAGLRLAAEMRGQPQGASDYRPDPSPARRGSRRF